MKQSAKVMQKLIAGFVAFGLAAGAVLLAASSRHAPVPPPPPNPPDAYADFGPVADAFSRPGSATPLASPRKRPSDALAAALEAVALGRPQDLSVHFAAPELAEPFYRRWQGQLPAGSTRVAQADQVDAGAENGHLVPVTVWVAGAEGVAGLRGEASFTAGPAGVQIRQLTLAALPLQVRTWSEAARRIQSVKAVAAPPQRAEAPFFGTFRLIASQDRFAVDALTGKVEQE